MLNKEKHQLIMGRILRDVYFTPGIAPLLGFKGGTCAYLFYGLPRFSVDLDFDLLQEKDGNQNLVFKTVKKILENYGIVKDNYIKRNTIFFLLSYGEEDRNIKFEASSRLQIPDIKKHFELKEYLGISMLAVKKSYMFAAKLAALTSRSETAMRDIYDIWFFAKNNWDIDEVVLKARAGRTIKEQLANCVVLIEQVKDNQILHGLGELISEKEKTWVKDKLRAESIFLLKNYIASLN